MLDALLMRVAKAAAYYATLIVLMRVAGKWLAGHTADGVKVATLEETGHISAIER